MSLPAFLLHIDTAENRTLCRARALNKRGAFVASGRGRRQAAEAGADLRSKYADSPRKVSTRYGCDVYRISAGLAQHQRIPQTAENRTLCRARALSKRLSDVEWGALSQWRSKRKVHPGISPQTGTRFPLHLPPRKPMRPPSQNWVEESQNAIAGGQYDCRR